MERRAALEFEDLEDLGDGHVLLLQLLEEANFPVRRGFPLPSPHRFVRHLTPLI